MSLEDEPLEFCWRDGCLVGSEMWIPANTCDHLNRKISGYVGCNQIHCSKCGDLVKQKTGYVLTANPNIASGKNEDLSLDSRDWDSLSFFRKDPQGTTRIYYCSCYVFSTDKLIWLNGDDDHLIYGPARPLSWKCGGHSPLSFPASFYGCDLHSEADLQGFIEGIIDHSLQPVEPLEKEEAAPEAYLISRFYLCLKEEAQSFKSVVDMKMKELLTHSQPIARFTACKFFENFPDSSTAEHLVKVWKERPEMYEGVSLPSRQKQGKTGTETSEIHLESQIKRAILSYLEYSGDENARGLIRALILGNKLKEQWKPFVKSIGVEWIEENVDALFLLDPELNLGPVLMSQIDKSVQEISDLIGRMKGLKKIPDAQFEKMIPYQINLKIG